MALMALIRKPSADHADGGGIWSVQGQEPMAAGRRLIAKA